jgi:hypothetical protein
LIVELRLKNRFGGHGGGVLEIMDLFWRTILRMKTVNYEARKMIVAHQTLITAFINK